ncbi:MAG: hypothetical protein ABIP51_20890 [Bacteroidia bacterium]
MKYILMLLCVCFFLTCIVNSDKKTELPKTWTKEFNITLHEGGGMRNASTTFFFSTDSCKYVEMEDGKDSTWRFKLSPKEQEEVSEKLNSFNVLAIESETTEITYDAETTTMCFNLDATKYFCSETGAASKIKERSAKSFSNAYTYLSNLAHEKSK